jgi:hypothetical protein
MPASLATHTRYVTDAPTRIQQLALIGSPVHRCTAQAPPLRCLSRKQMDSRNQEPACTHPPPSLTGPGPNRRLRSGRPTKSGGALLLYCEGRPEAANLGAWTSKALTDAGLTDLSSVISPHLPTDRSVKAAEKRKLLALLKRIPVTEFSIGNAVIRSVANSSEANALALVDYLMSVEAVRTLVASALQGLGPADANPSDFLRTQLLRSVDRALPEWSNAWLDPLSED